MNFSEYKEWCQKHENLKNKILVKEEKEIRDFFFKWLPDIQKIFGVYPFTIVALKAKDSNRTNIKKENDRIIYGVVRCSAGDNWDYEKGILYAYAKAQKIAGASYFLSERQNKFSNVASAGILPPEHFISPEGVLIKDKPDYFKPGDIIQINQDRFVICQSKKLLERIWLRNIISDELCDGIISANNPQKLLKTEIMEIYNGQDEKMTIKLIFRDCIRRT